MAKEHLGEWVDGISDSPSGGGPPGGDPPNGNPSVGGPDDDDVRDAVLRVLERFCRELDFRLRIFTGKDPSMLEVFDSEVTLTAEMIGQKVHRFVAEWLIDPVVSVLNYAYISEPREPAGMFGEMSEQIYPDFRLLPRQWEGNTPPDIIGEVKKPGGHHAAVTDVCEYLFKLEAPAYGIATDGLVWHGRRRENGGIEPFKHISQVSLRSLLHRIRKGIVHNQYGYELEQFRNSNSLNRFLELFDQVP